MLALLIAAALLVLPVAANAQGNPITDYVDNAVEAVRTTCYEARMTYLSQVDDGLEQQVHIYHVAPELFRVVPLVGGEEGETVYIENAVELTRIRNGYAETMPNRQFNTNDNLTIKFLRDLGRHPGTTLLDGKAGGREVYVLRQDLSQAKPYTITVGLDKLNFYPVFLLVLDAQGRRRVYYEMDVIEYCAPTDIADRLFMLESDYKQLPPPRIKSSSAQSLDQTEELSGSWLPLIPDPLTLPAGYFLESISSLDFYASGNRVGEPEIVYQLAIFGPGSDLLSIFQTRASDWEIQSNDPIIGKDITYVLTRKDGWTVAAFGSVGIAQLEAIIDSLHIDKVIAQQLIVESHARHTLLFSD